MAELNRLDRGFHENHLSEIRHFVLTFHDETLECVAQETATRTEPTATMPEVVARLSSEVLG
jgi:hypothetical protein